MCSSAPSKSSTARPWISSDRYGSLRSHTAMLTRGSRSRCPPLARTERVLNTAFSPSQSIHTTVDCGPPFARTVATTAKFGSISSWACVGVKVTIRSPSSGSLARTVAGRALSLPQHASDRRRMLPYVRPLDIVQRAIAEFVGTFALLFIGAGTASIYGSAQDASGIIAIAIGTGLAIAVMVTAVGHISGGHFNPAVTLGFIVTRRIHAINAVIYWIAQFGSAALAVLLLKWILPSATSP